MSDVRIPILCLIVLLHLDCYREAIIYQAGTGNQSPDFISIDTSQLPPGVIETNHNTRDLGINPSSIRVIRPQYRFRILIVPATEP